MFGKKKVAAADKLTTPKDSRKAAIDLLTEETIDCEKQTQYNYILGLTQMAFTLGVISQNERAMFNDAAYNRYQRAAKEREEKSLALAEERKRKAAEEKAKRKSDGK